MLRLLLLRHAKSSWDDVDLSDHERPLSKRGVNAASAMGAYMKSHKLKPGLVLCSDSVRTRATLALVLRELKGEPPYVQYSNDLYLANPAELLRRVCAIQNDTSTVMLVGHNPGMQALALKLVGGGNRKALRALAMKYPTAGLAVIDFGESAWDEIKLAGGELIDFVTPRKLA